MTHLLAESVMLTVYAAAMMLMIEYRNMVGSGKWSQWLARRPHSAV